MASFDIGAKLQQERVGRGLTIDEISRQTRIAPRFLEAIEASDFSRLPGLIFARNFVRQYARSLNLDPEPLLAELPKQDESTVQLPNPPEHRRSSYYRDRRVRALFSSLAWLTVGGLACVAAYIHFNHSLRTPERETATPIQTATLPHPETPPAAPAQTVENSAPVQVSLLAHAAAWVQVITDGKITFTGTLQANETKEISAAEQVKLTTGNAGALTISLNGKTLDSLGSPGEVRAIKLTAEGPEFLSRSPQPVYDPL
ncbi:MAG TPA: RodZ domain-containing protein [Bryobacteraceae bacterium]|nr:RodZ domain-containing protein [Bryobacteraceae bacterium]